MIATSLSYPIGKFQAPSVFTEAIMAQCIADIESLPQRLKAVLAPLNAAQLNTPYRPGGWKVYQLVHHIADSHMNSFIRFKLALTEDNPVIKPYDEGAWAVLPDSENTAPAVSLQLLTALHQRWVNLLRGMSATDWERTFRHPDFAEALSLKTTLGLYAWHSNHHLAHIERLVQREGWSLPQ